jgi:hypothetical protein
LPNNTTPSTNNSTAVTVELLAFSHVLRPLSTLVAEGPPKTYSATGTAMLRLDRTTNSTNTDTVPAEESLPCATVTAAATVSERFFGLAAESKRAIPNALAAVTESIARIQPGNGGCSPGLGLFLKSRTASPTSRSPSRIFMSAPRAEPPPPDPRPAPPERAAATIPTTDSPTTHPARKAGPLLAGLRREEHEYHGDDGYGAEGHAQRQRENIAYRRTHTTPLLAKRALWTSPATKATLPPYSPECVEGRSRKLSWRRPRLSMCPILAFEGDGNDRQAAPLDRIDQLPVGGHPIHVDLDA